MTVKTTCMAAAAALALAAPASAAVVVPAAGSSTFGIVFQDNGDLVLDEIYDPSFSTVLGFDAFTLSLASAATVEIGVLDCCIAGDEYGLLLDGVSTAFTTASFDSLGYFQGLYSATLAAGTHSISFEITKLVGGLSAGGTATFDVAAVPLPASATLLLAALGGAGLAARRRRAG